MNAALVHGHKGLSSAFPKEYLFKQLFFWGGSHILDALMVSSQLVSQGALEIFPPPSLLPIVSS